MQVPNGIAPYKHIDAHTALFAIIGDPVSHSLSPVMHNAAFLITGINAVYVALRVTDPGDAVTGIRALGLAGASITIPHKVTVMEYLDDIDPMAQAIGAVNTVVNKNGRLIGYNTDGWVAVRALKEKTELLNKRVAIIGAGGAARAIGYAVAEAGSSIIIVNRTPNRGKALAATLQADFMLLETFSGDNCDIIINTTPVGMTPQVDDSPLDAALIKPGVMVMDIIYNPRITRLLQAAINSGGEIVSGVDMFVYQGVAQFGLWTQTSAPVKQMRAAVMAALQAPSP